MNADIIGLNHGSTCDCCGKRQIDTVVVRTGSGATKQWGCVCASHIFRRVNGEPMKPSDIKKAGAFMRGVYECGNQDFLRRPVMIAA